jgi:hypothetical protein
MVSSWSSLCFFHLEVVAFSSPPFGDKHQGITAPRIYEYLINMQRKQNSQAPSTLLRDWFLVYANLSLIIKQKGFPSSVRRFAV